MSESLLQSFAENTDDILFAIGPGATLTYVSPNAVRVLGTDPRELLGSSVYRYVHPEDVDVVSEYVERLHSGAAAPDGIWYRLQRSDGSYVWHAVRGAALRDESGRVREVLGISRDITDRRDSEERLRMAAEETESVNRILESQVTFANEMAIQADMASKAKSEFLANMSHEIRTPLNGVIGMTSLLLETRLDEEQRRFAQILKTSGEALLAIVSDILDFSKIEAGRLELDMIDFDLRSLVDDLVAPLAHRAQEKSLEFVCHIDPAVTESVHGDPVRLRQILVNLIGNAVKFTHSGEIVVRIEPTEHSAHGEQHAALRFIVTDSGIGIPEDRLEDIFTQFMQVDGSTTRKYGGTGLGLTITRQLAAMMGGEVSVQSEPGRGSEFSVVIPLARSSERASPGVHPQLSGTRILVADHSEASRTAMRVLLESWGVVVSTAADASSAAAMLHAAAGAGGEYHAVLVDVALIDSDEQLDSALSRDGVRSTRLIVMAPHGRRIAGGLALLDRADGRLTKPARRVELHTVLSKVLAGPVRQAHEERPVADSTPSPVAAVSSDAAGRSDAVVPARFGGARILVAEDNVINQKVADAMLGRLGLQPVVVDSGDAALLALAGEPFDLVLMDVQMPGRDGYETTAIIRGGDVLNANRLVPIIAMTAYAQPEDRDRCLRVGMNDYLAKPVEPDALLETLLRWLPGDAAYAVDPTVFDEAGLRRRISDDTALFAAIIDAFSRDYVAYLSRLQELTTELPEPAVTRALARQAHLMKGAAATVGAPGLAHLCEAIGSAAVATPADAGRIVELVDQVGRAYPVVLRRMQASLERHP